MFKLYKVFVLIKCEKEMIIKKRHNDTLKNYNPEYISNIKKTVQKPCPPSSPPQ